MEQSRLNNGHTQHIAPLPFDLAQEMEKAKEKFSDLSTKAVAFIKERPAMVLFGALCVGFAIGRLASRR